MLVNAADMLKKAEAGKYGLGAFNTNNLEWTLAILQAAEEAKSPLILQCTAGAAKWMGGFKVCADMVKAAVEATGVTVPVALHLDHGLPTPRACPSRPRSAASAAPRTA